jgi:hypothetical protein
MGYICIPIRYTIYPMPRMMPHVYMHILYNINVIFLVYSPQVFKCFAADEILKF